MGALAAAVMVVMFVSKDRERRARLTSTSEREGESGSTRFGGRGAAAVAGFSRYADDVEVEGMSR